MVAADIRNLADEEVMQLVGEGDPRAFELLYDRHGSAAFSLAYRMVGDRVLAEDISQEAFLSIWRSRMRYDPSRGSVRTWVLGILDVNGWHNVVHIASGAIGLLVARSYGGSRVYAIGLGAVYLVVALLGFIAGDGDEIFNLIPVNTSDNFLHLLIGLAGIGGGLATPATLPPSTVARPA